MAVVYSISLLTNHIAAFDYWPITLQHLDFEIQMFQYDSMDSTCAEYTTADQSHCSIQI